ncbi:MAG: T9SS type A sorting domain-containing protein [Saprospiraceae bacterium]|nr:T9SS type A sorting domain-containing protein [Saprospiraceae bacterium]
MKTALLLLAFHFPLLAYTYHFIPEESWRTVSKVETKTTNKVMCTITVQFSGSPGACNDNGTPNDISDDFYTHNIQASFFSRPSTGNLQIVPGGDVIGTYSIAVNQIIGNSHIFTGVQFKADGSPSIVQMNFTDETTCIDEDTGPTIEPCPPPPCTITVDFSGSPGPCNDNGTPNDISDDFYTHNIRASFFNRPFTGNLQIVPGGDAIGTYFIQANQIVGNAHTFTGVQLKADGSPSIVQMNFTDEPTCIDEDTGPTVEPCPPPPCTITVDFSGSPGPCNNNGTPGDLTDDYYTHNIRASFFNRPFTGNLQIVPGGDVIGSYFIEANQIVGNAHTFTGVQLKAEGTPSIVQMNFTDEPTCIDEDTGPAIGPCICDLVVNNIVTTPEICPGSNTGSITVTASSGSLPINFAISGPVNLSNGTGLFPDIPGSAYTVTVTDANSCSDTDNAIVNSGMDNTPPIVSCNGQTLIFNGQNNLVLNPNSLVSTTDNCGLQSITANPVSISCDQVGQIIPVIITVTDQSNNTSSCISNITAEGLPCGWNQNANGVGCIDGNSISFNPTTEIWTASSSNCFYSTPFTSDAMAFGQKTLCGNGSITAQLIGISGPALGWAGVIMRESNAPGAKKAQLTTNMSGNQSRREFRLSNNGAAIPQNFPTQNRFWLQIVRSGNQFTMYHSPNGTQWFLVGVQNIVMSTCIEIGLIATNFNANSTISASFANVASTGNSPLIQAAIDNVIQEAHSIIQPDFYVYPNPASSLLNFDLKEYIDRNVQIELYSLEGKLRHKIQFDKIQETTQTIRLDNFSGGLYFIKLKSAGLPDVTKRVMLNK